ncbi:3994_t:CDS:10 [Entrophospora sp. SA101]|nr:3994_t:CDS:10 [Entrophospora sp. SA101]
MEPEASTSNLYTTTNSNDLKTIPLSKFLQLCPANFDYKLSEDAKQKILGRLFSEFWKSNEDYRDLFFPNGFGDGNYEYKLSLAQSSNVNNHSLEKGRPCGHVFKKGEGVYRCRDCAIDGTCVFCTRCFHATDHEDHDVIFSITTSWSGCCDCGDPEAWKVPIHCAYHSPEITNTLDSINSRNLPTDLLNSIHEAISTVLVFMIDTLSASPEEKLPPSEVDQVKKEAIESSYSIRYLTTTPDEKLFAIILWNDESHSFSEVIDQLADATGCTKDAAKSIAERVDSYGRDIVEISDDIPRLLSIARTISSIGLAVTIRSARDTFREEMCGLFIDWLKDLANGMVGSNIHVLREIICEELCKKWKKPLDERYENEDVDSNQMSDGDEAMEYDRIVETGSIDEMSTDERSIDTTTEPMEEDESPTSLYKASTTNQLAEDFNKKLRLDKLFLLDFRLWKEARSGLKKLYIKTLATDPEYKKIMGIRFARNYVKIAKAFLTPDREPEYSIILFSIQLFPIATISSILVNKYHFLSTIFAVFHTFFTSDAVGDVKDIDPSARINCEAPSFKNRCYFHIFSDFKNIMSTTAVKESVHRHSQYLVQYLNLITLFQGMNPNVRATQQHVEYETESWVNAFNVTLQIAKSCRQFSECYTVNTKVLSITIRKTLKKLYEWCARHVEDDMDNMDETNDEQQVTDTNFNTNESYAPFSRDMKYSYYTRIEDSEDNSIMLRDSDFHDVMFPQNPYSPTYRVIKFDVSSQPVSFHHPLHWFLAQLIENVELLDEDLLKQNGWDSFQNMVMDINSENADDSSIVIRAREKMLAILDYPLRVQIRAGLWVRNGFGIRSQCHHYRDVSLRENTYDEDVFLIQTAFIILDPDLVLATILDRFDLIDWFNGKSSHKTYDSTQLTFIVEELLILLITCVNERTNAAGLSIEEEIKSEIIHSLCLGPLAYSELSKRIPERLTQSTSFDKVLPDLANYRSPDSLTDNGLYELKDQYFDDVDPYFMHYSRNNREEAEDVLKNRSKKKMDDSEKDKTPLIIPKLVPITKGPYVKLGNILHVRLMNQIIYYSLWNVKKDNKIKSDTIMEEALHLIILALLDENNDAIKEYKRKGKQKASDNILSTNDTYYPTGFMYYAVSDRFQDPDVNIMKSPVSTNTLLDLLLDLSSNSNFKDYHHKINYILDQFEKHSNENVRFVISNHREKLNDKLQTKAQQSFIDKHESFYDIDEGMYDDEWEITTDEHLEGDLSKETIWPFPTGTCIVCQEDTNSSSLYGMLGLIQPSTLMRRTPFNDNDFVFETINLPENLDNKYDRSMPYGVASSLYSADDNSSKSSRVLLSKGFPSDSCRLGMYASTCGHLMHVKCFDNYFLSLEQRHQLQLTRNHPEDVKRKEFLCPLCKSLGNVLFPITWKGKKEVFPGVLEVQEDFGTWINSKCMAGMTKLNSFAQSLDQTVFNEPPRRYTQNLRNSFDVRDLAQTTGFSPLAQTQRRRNSSGAGRFISQIVHMLRTPTQPTDDNTGGPIIGGPGDEFQPNIDRIITIRMYDLLAEVVEKLVSSNKLEITFQTTEKSLKHIEYMWDLFGYTISCIEISQRGVGNSVNENQQVTTLMNGINSQTSTLLRILSETLDSYLNIMLAGQEYEVRLKQIATHRLQQIFYEHPLLQPNKAEQDIISNPLPDSTRRINGLFDKSFLFTKVKPLLLEDPFLILVELCFNNNCCYNDSNNNNSIRSFTFWIMRQLGYNDQIILKFLNEIGDQMFAKIIRSFSLPYLRKCIILLHARFGVVFPSSETEKLKTDEIEFVRLCKLLRLPSMLEEICAINTDTTTDFTKLAVIAGWCHHLFVLRQELSLPFTQSVTTPIDRNNTTNLLVSSSVAIRSSSQTSANDPYFIDIQLNHPAIFELIGLPKRLDFLFEESMRRVCKKCNTIPNEPALCLLCGAFVCSQSYCCFESERGECNNHARSCGGDKGIYLLVKKCVLLLLHNDNGCFMNAPYLDTHGEVDHGLKRGKPQYLNQKRYDEIRRLWITHGVPVQIARKIEQIFDVGGWSTIIYTTSPALKGGLRSLQKTKKHKAEKQRKLEESSKKPDPIVGRPTPFTRSLLKPDEIFKVASAASSTTTTALNTPSGFNNFLLNKKDEKFLFEITPKAVAATETTTDIKNPPTILDSANKIDDENSSTETLDGKSLEIKVREKTEIEKVQVLKKLVSLQNSDAKAIQLYNIQKAIEEFGGNERNTGTPEVQAAVYTVRILNLHDHFKKFHKDLDNYRSLRHLVHKRQKILKYLKRVNLERYYKCLERLGLDASVIEGEIVI